MQTTITKAMNHLNRGEFNLALEIFIHLTSIQAKNPQFWHFRAVSERKLDFLKASENHFLKALKLAPTQPEILNAYGNLLNQLGRCDLAKKQFVKAINNNSKYIDPHINLGNLLYAETSYILAEQSFNNALLLNNNINAQVGLAKCYKKTENTSKAKNILLKILEYTPTHKQSLHLLGQIEKELGNITKAKEYFKSILVQPGEHTESNKALASCYLIEKNIDASINEYEKIIQYSPLDYDAHHQLSLIKWSKSLPAEECFSNYEYAISITKSSVLMGQLANKLLQAKEYDKAIKIADKILTLNNSDPIAYIIKSNSLRELGEFEEAIITSNQGLKKNSNNLGLLYEQGHAYIANGNADVSLKIFNQLCKYNQSNLSCVTLKSTSLKMLDKTNEYNELCDPNKFIYAREIKTPNNEDSLVNFNQQLNSELIQLHNSKKHPLDQSLINGTQTIGDLFPSKSHYINLLDSEIKKQVDSYISRFTPNKKHPFLKHITPHFQYQGSWSVLLQKQGFHKNHYHSEGWISGPYYNQIPNAVEGSGEGWIEFGIPEFNMRDKLEADYIVKPQDGLLLLFPSYFWHGTRAFTSDETRMTVAFDVIPK
ncbi:MAG: tetratricopeptide (TPR) repeat protein [Cognaticolwellia sp.]|jgi:tetratricopeptide (TPR) repeat protein